MSGSVPTLPTTVTSAGLTPIPPATLNALIIALAQTYSPGLTANLPGSLIDDVSGTDTATLVVCDQERVETIASVSPYTANPWLLTQLGQIYLGQGSTAAAPTNTSVYVVFTGPAGFVIPPGFTVGDGTYQYTVTLGGVIAAGGTSALIYAQAVQSGSWAVPAGTVTQIITSVPSTISLSVTNPSDGTPGTSAETEAQYRLRVLQSGLVASTGMQNYLKTLLQQVPGVESQLVSIRSPAANQWEIIVGGTGDPYAIGLAIFQAVQDISTLVGSTLGVAGITQANPGVVSTTLNHGYTTGQTVTIAGVNPSNYNGSYTATVLTPTTFSIGTNTTSFPAYVSGGVVTPNFRNTSVAINSFPDTYTIPFVIPPVQTVTVTVTWNTSSSNFVSPTGVAQLVQPAIAAYINALPVGAPINVLELNDTFITAVASILPENLITVLVFSVTIDGITVAPGTGTQIIVGDPESYFSCAASSVTVVQG